MLSLEKPALKTRKIKHSAYSLTSTTIAITPAVTSSPTNTTRPCGSITGKCSVRFCQKEKDVRILDIGCGTGFAVNALLAASYANTRGIDATTALVETARSRGLPVEFVKEDETEQVLRSISGTLDTALLFEVVEHLERDRQIGFLQSVRGDMKPSGLFLCQVPNAPRINAAYLRFNDRTHRCLFTASSLTFASESGGFRVDTVIGANGRPSPLRNGRLRVLMPLARNTLQAAVNVFWRIPVIANLGLPLGLTHSVKPTLLAIGKPR